MTSPQMSEPNRPTAPAGAGAPFDERALASAVALLASGQESPQDAAILTDEELIALDGILTPQFAETPFLQSHAPDEQTRAMLARTAMRSLMVRRVVVSEIEASEIEERPLADENLLNVTIEPRTLGALVLRRSSRAVLVLEREVSEEIHRLYYYPHDSGIVLEEEVTADGVHVFTVMPDASVAVRARHLVDQLSLAGEDGEPVVVAADQLESHPELGPLLEDTRALTVATLLLQENEDEPRRAVFHMTSQQVLAGEEAGDGTVSIMEVSTATIEAVLTALLEEAREGEEPTA